MSDKKGSDSLNTDGGGPLKVSYIFPNGDRYEGECSRSAYGALMHGRGTVQYPSGAQYEGEFKDNMYNGTGTYTFPDGSMCKGHFHNNRLEGDGAFISAQGLFWTGEFHGKAALGLKLEHNL
ncbi:MORN repeat-containing protein 2 isoform X2 [Pundamilia nyererei]|uniref:MORN repeat-containing protein 2 isoform X2 n=1 Tax=Pundamilia nyererei TaxID=303518 RepID=A0A9Y3R120_9CICH|nr:PREDICTED: MORN repeat-containing protein 2 isoform X2 [Pundamilia nyererei]